MRFWRGYLTLFACVGIGTGACSLLVKTDADQCNADSDCAHFGAMVCNAAEHVCVPTQVTDTGTVDAGCWDETGFGGHGCYRCEPKTNDELLNACANYAYVAFDNTKRIKGFDPANPKPPLPALDAAVDTSSPPDTGTADAAMDSGPPPDTGSGLPACPDITTLKNPVVMVAATGLLMQPTVDAVGDITVVWRVVGSCDGANAVTISGLKATGDISILKPGEPEFKCHTDAIYPADIGSGGLFWDTCNPTVPQPPDIDDLLGPVTPIGFIVPAASKQNAISNEAAYKVYGFGSNSGVDPWTDASVIFRRNISSGNQGMVSLTLGIPLDRILGVDSNGGGNMIKVVANVPPAKAENTIGFSSAEQMDKSRTIIRMLAYQHVGQTVGFFWDSDPSAFDRRPIRDGHSFMWEPEHVFVHVVGGAIVGANPSLDAIRPKTLVSDFAEYLAVRKPLPKGIDIFSALKDPTGGAAAVPQCAMTVTRRKDGGPLEPYTPPRSCACAFEAAPPGSRPAECKACSSDTDCPADRPVCSFGYCEVR